MRLGLFNEGGKGHRLVNGEIGENLTVNTDTSLVEAVDEARIDNAMLTNGSVQTLDPERADRTLLGLTVAGGVLHRAINSSLSCADRIFATAIKALRGLENFFMLGVGCYTPFNTCHDGSPSEEMLKM